MKQLSKEEALKEAENWWQCKISYKENKRLLIKYYKSSFFTGEEDVLSIYLSEHPEITITQELSLFEKCENLWQNLNAFVILDGKVDMEFLKQVLIDNKPSKNDK